MCVISMVGDHFNDKWRRDYPNWPWPNPTQPVQLPNPQNITREEFEQLKRDVAEMKDLLIRAKKYDEEHNQPQCEMEEKIDILRKVAKLVGVELDEIFGKDSNNKL